MHWLILAMVAPLALHAKPIKHGKGHGANACPFVGQADIQQSGSVENVVGLSLSKSRSVQAFDVDGAVGKLWGSSSGLRFSGRVPAKIKNSTFTHVLLVDGALRGLRVAEPDKDLPQGIFSDAVQIYLADGKGGRVALVSIPGQSQDDACSEIDCKVRSTWKRCWTDCKAPSQQPVLTP